MTIRTPNNSYYVSGASGGQDHTLPFGADRFEDDDLFVYVWNTSTEAWDKKTVTTHYTVSSTQVSFTSSHIPSTRVIVLRKTDVDEDFPKADFVAGASIKAQDLDNNQLQALRGIKELRDQKLSAVPSIAEDGTPSNPKMYANLDMNGYKVINQPAGYITSTDILDGTIATADIADSAITTAKIADQAVTTSKIANDSILNNKIADNQIDSEHYVDGSIDTEHIADQAVSQAKIANNSVATNKIQDGAITSAKYATGSIGTTAIADEAISTGKLANGAVGAGKLASDAVTTVKIADQAVTQPKIANNSVATNKIQDGAVTNAKLADAELVELATMGGNTASALADLTQAEVQILDGATVTTAELNTLDGVTATATELNQLDGNTLKTTGTDFTSSSQFPAASEIDARITARIDPLGGFEAIADEDSFPATAPPAGTVISIANANGLAVNSSGVGAGTRTGGSDAVVINGFPSTFNSTSLDDGIGLLVVATSTAHTYDFHRVVAKNEDVRQLSSDINDFKARYRIGSSNPTTDNDAGDLFFNTGTSKMLVRNAGNTAWQEVQAVGDFFINTLSSSSGTGGGSATFNGTAYRFTLSNAPTYAQQLLVSINGVVQKPNSGTSQPSEGFALDGSDIILAAAPATGADSFFITIGSSVGIGTPSDNTVSTDKLVNGAVTTVKLADDAVTGNKIISDAVTGAKIADDAVGAEHIEVLDANLQFADSAKAQFGAGNDLEIYHDGTHSYISDQGAGNLKTLASSLVVKNAADTETMLQATQDGAVELYHDNSKKLETQSIGITVTGQVACDELDLADSTGAGNNRIKLGAGDDLQIYHDGSNSYVDDSGTGDLYIRSNRTRIGKYTGEDAIVVNADGDVELFHDNSKVMETMTGGIDVIGELQCDSLDVDGAASFTGGDVDFNGASYQAFWDYSKSALRFQDNAKANFGTSEDLKIYHDGTHSYINDGGTGNLKVLTSSLVVKNAADSEIMLQATQDGAVDLYHNNSKKFETLSNGVRVQGGVLFGSDTADVNALDDYEEGTWTATLSSGTCSTADGKYIKIGNLVRISARLNNFSDRSSSNIVQITNAPFTSNGGQSAQAAGSMFGKYLNLTAFASYVGSTGNIEFYSIPNGNWAALGHNNLTNSVTQIYFFAQYQLN